MKKKIFRTICAIILCITTLLGVQIRTPLSVYASEQKTPYNVALEIIDWKKSDVGSTSDGYLINDTFLTQAGTTPGDWYPIGLGRLGIKDNQEGYLAVINDNVQKRYQTSAKLDKSKATEWHRISLAVLASGGNPRRMGANGEIDLIADGTYNRVDGKGNGILGRQGINGFIWGLIAIDSMQYEVPKNAYYSRDDMILNILNRQLADGGWALTGNVSDPDMTGMAIQALAPYYNSEKEYIYENKKLQADGSKITKKVRTVVDEAISWLSLAQNTDGGYSSWGTENCESAVQVAVALCALGIDIFTDIRFIKDGNTIYDAILSYQNADGGFLHSLQYDPENPSSLPDKSNTMASEQTLYGMVAIHRYQNGMRRLFDFRQEQSEALKSQITEVETQIETINENTSKQELQGVYNSYWTIPSLERSYVKNYAKLSELLEKSSISYYEEEMIFNSGDAGVIVPIEIFTDLDMTATNALPTVLTTEYRAEVLRLFSKINNCFDFDDKQTYYIKLEKAKNAIEEIQNKIDAIKTEIKDKLYPFDKISLSDRETIHVLYERYMALSDYDKTQLESSDVEGLLKSKTQVDNLYLAVWISGISVVIGGIATVIIVVNVRKRKREKASRQMPESEE